MADLNSNIGNGVFELHAEINYSGTGSGTGDYNELVNKPSINGIVIQHARKNKRNQYMFTKEYYERQNSAVDNLYKKGSN